MQFYDDLMKFDKKIIGFKFKITFGWGRCMSSVVLKRRKSINKVFVCDFNPHKSEGP